MSEKICNKCCEAKPLAAFHRNRRQADGHHYWCAACVNSAVNALNRTRKDRTPKHRRPTSKGGVYRRGTQQPGSLTARMLALLAERPMTVDTLSEALRVSDRSIRARLGLLRRRDLVQLDGHLPRHGLTGRCERVWRLAA